MLENEWRSLGIQQSKGWVHYAMHKPEPHVLLFRRPKNQQQSTINATGNNNTYNTNN